MKESQLSSEVKKTRRLFTAGRIALGIVLPPVIGNLVYTGVYSFQYFQAIALGPESGFDTSMPPQALFLLGLVFMYYLAGIQSILGRILMEIVGCRIFRPNQQIDENLSLSYLIWGTMMGLLVGFSMDLFANNSYKPLSILLTYIGGAAGLATSVIFLQIWRWELRRMHLIEHPEERVLHYLPYEKSAHST